MVDATCPECKGPLFEGWLTIAEAAELSGYSPAYLRRLASQEIVDAHKVGRDWLVDRESLEAYRREMEALGAQRHNPWREDLAAQGRGRQTGR